MSTLRADDDRLSRCSRGPRALARGVSFGSLASAECFPLTKITTESRGRRKRLRNASKSKSTSKSRIRIHPKDVRLLVDLHWYTHAKWSRKPATHCHAFETWGGRRRRNVSRRILNLFSGIRIGVKGIRRAKDRMADVSAICHCGSPLLYTMSNRSDEPRRYSTALSPCGFSFQPNIKTAIPTTGARPTIKKFTIKLPVQSRIAPANG
jgi:hypothetical protein